MSTSRRLNFFLASLLVAAAVGCSSNDTPYSAPEPQPDASDASEDVAEPNDASTKEDAKGDEPAVVDAADEPDAQNDGEAPVEASADAGTDAEEVPDALDDGAASDAASEAGSGDAEADAAPQDSGADAAEDASVDASTDAPSDVSADAPIDVSADVQQGDAATDGEAEGGEDSGAEAGEDGAACQILGGLGQVQCVCNELDDTEWNADAPFLFTNSVDFGTTGWDLSLLTPGGKQIWDDGNLGGSSIESEIAAYEMLARCDQASLILSESKIDYIDEGGKKTDILMLIDGRNIGVSVVRAYHYPPTNPYTEAEATTILTKKLSDIPLSQKNAESYNSWGRSMLAVIAYDQQYADTVVSAWHKLDASLKWNVIVVVTVTNGDDSVIY